MATYRCGSCEAFTDQGERCIGCGSKVDRSGTPQEVTATALERAIALAPVPVLVDFWAPWCAPCRMAAPMVRALASKLAGELVVLSVDTQDEPDAGESHAIYAIPTFAIFRGGEELSRQMGLLPRQEMERWVRGVLSPPALEAR